MTTPELSVVVPCHNEAKNLRPLLAAIHDALDALGLNYEVVITDDCSSDDSWRVLQELGMTDPRPGPGCKSRRALISLRSTPIYRTIRKICRQ